MYLKIGVKFAKKNAGYYVINGFQYNQRKPFLYSSSGNHFNIQGDLTFDLVARQKT